MMQRRKFIKALFALSASALLPIKAFAAMWNTPAFQATKLQEAMAALQRSLEFFAREGNLRITWKIRYYLSVAALLRSQQNGDPVHRETWRQMASSLLQEALKESGVVESEFGMPRASSGEGDFSPGLRPDVLDPLKQALGFGKARKGERRQPKERVVSAKRYTGYLH